MYRKPSVEAEVGPSRQRQIHESFSVKGYPITHKMEKPDGGAGLASTKAIIFDFIGTLTNVKGYSLKDSEARLCKAISRAGFDAGSDCFLDAYGQAHEKYRIVRYQELVEVTNAIWIAEALNSLGFKTDAEDPRIKMAVNIFFENYVDSLELRPCAKNVLRKASRIHKVGLVSNFTYSPVIYAGLRKLGINRFFNAVLVSQEVGWRKPHKIIFETALQRLEVTAEETVYVGDSPLEDINGAASVGMNTVFVSSQFYSLEALAESGVKPQMTVLDICELAKKLPQFLEKSSA